MLYPINPLMTREEMMQFDRLRYLSTAINALQDWQIAFSDERMSLLKWLGKTEARYDEVEAALSDVEWREATATDRPTDHKALKDAEAEVTNCTKLIHRIQQKLADVEARAESTNKQFTALDAIYAKICDDYPVAWNAFLNWQNVPRR
jgi:chromosome segregation ATPase